VAAVVAIAEAEEPEVAANAEQMQMPQRPQLLLLTQPDVVALEVSVEEMRMQQHRPQPHLPTQLDVVALEVSVAPEEEEAAAASAEQPYPQTEFLSQPSAMPVVPCQATCPSSPGRRN
jgi:hypothetical protein